MSTCGNPAFRKLFRVLDAKLLLEESQNVIEVLLYFAQLFIQALHGKSVRRETIKHLHILGYGGKYLVIGL
jgi:hypothetical protein